MTSVERRNLVLEVVLEVYHSPCLRQSQAKQKLCCHSRHNLRESLKVMLDLALPLFPWFEFDFTVLQV